VKTTGVTKKNVNIDLPFCSENSRSISKTYMYYLFLSKPDVLGLSKPH